MAILLPVFQLLLTPTTARSFWNLPQPLLRDFLLAILADHLNHLISHYFSPFLSFVLPTFFSSPVLSARFSSFLSRRRTFLKKNQKKQLIELIIILWPKKSSQIRRRPYSQWLAKFKDLIFFSSSGKSTKSLLASSSSAALLASLIKSKSFKSANLKSPKPDCS